MTDLNRKRAGHPRFHVMNKWVEYYGALELEPAEERSGELVPQLEIHGRKSTVGLVATSLEGLPDDVDPALFENLARGVERLAVEQPDTACRVYLGEGQVEFLPRLLELGCEVCLVSGGTGPLGSGLLPLLALADSYPEGVTFTRPERFWYAADDVARTRLLADGSLFSWRVLDTWCPEPESYCPLSSYGWGTRQEVPVLSLLVAFLRQVPQTNPEVLEREFLIRVLYPRLASGGFLSLMIAFSPPARHWVALDIEQVTRRNPDSELHILSEKAEANSERVPSFTYRGIEMPIAGVLSSHQKLPVFSRQLREVQDTLRNTLRDIHVFALGHNIRYSLWGATLLGLYTTGDFLPWDDDIDILVHPDDFVRLEAIWQSCPPASTIKSYHTNSYDVRHTRIITLSGRKYEFLCSGPGKMRILYKLRPLGSREIFPNDPGGVDLTSIRWENGEWLERWSVRQRRLGPEAFESGVEEVLFSGVPALAYRPEVIGPLLHERYPLDWSRHPSLSRKEAVFQSLANL